MKYTGNRGGEMMARKEETQRRNVLISWVNIVPSINVISGLFCQLEPK